MTVTSEICVHCLNSEGVTRDHIFPKAWYPEKTSETQQRWTAPSCKKCNGELAKVEERLLVKLGLCLDPKELSSLGVTHRAMRSINPEAGKDIKDKAARTRARERIIKEMIHLTQLPKDGVLPNFGHVDGVTYDRYGALLIGEDDLQRYAEKLVRGLTYNLDGVCLPKETRIELNVVDVRRAQQELGDLFDRGQTVRQGDAIVVRRITTADGKAIYHFKIWKRLEFYVVVIPPTAEGYAR